MKVIDITYLLFCLITPCLPERIFWGVSVHFIFTLFISGIFSEELSAFRHLLPLLYPNNGCYGDWLCLYYPCSSPAHTHIPATFSLSSAIDERSKEGLREIDNKYASKLGIQKLSAENWVTKGLSYTESCNGPSYAETESCNAAINSFNSALGIDVANDRAWVSKGICLERLDKTDEAIACCDRALKIKPEFIEALLDKGLCIENLGKFEGAIDCYSKSIRTQSRAWKRKKIQRSLLTKIIVFV